MKRFNLILLSGLFFCFQNIYCQLDTINNHYFSNLRATLSKDKNISEIKLVQTKIIHDKGFIQSMYVKYKDDPNNRYWHIGKEFIYNTNNNSLGFISNVDIKTKVLTDTSFSYTPEGKIASLEIYNLKYDSIISIKRGNSVWSGIFGKYYEKTPNFYKAIQYTCNRDTIIERNYKYSAMKGFVIDGDVIVSNKDNKFLKKVHYDMGLEKPYVSIDSSRFGQFIDNRDMHVYPTIKIGEQIWLAKNLSYKPETGKYWIYKDDKDNIKKFGYLYNWETSKNICPTGTHLPNKEEYEVLIQTIGKGDSKVAYKELLPSGNSGFSAIFAGCRFAHGGWSINEKGTAMWSSTEKNRFNAWAINFSEYNPPVGLNGHISKTIGIAVRCIVDK